MGSGKTSWSMQYINEHTDENVLYITPYLSELEEHFNVHENDLEQRPRPHAIRPFTIPQRTSKTKLENIETFLGYGRDIASTHALFKRFNVACKQQLERTPYTLILDEAVTPVEQFVLPHKDDMKYLEKHKAIQIDNVTGQVHWIEDVENLDTRYNDIYELAIDHRLFRVDGSFYVWQYPPEIFTLFDKVFVMTYLFDGSLLKYYFDLHGISYTNKCIVNDSGKYTLADYRKPDKTAIKERLHVYDGKMNSNFKQRRTTFSSNYFKNSTKHKPEITQVRNNLINLFQNQYNAKSTETMWTTFKDSKHLLSGKGYTNGFVPCNARATNEFSDRKYLAYCLNLFMQPEICKYFTTKGIDVNQDLWALSEMVQWIWRSAIRNGQDVYLYIPSERMRTLLLQWLAD